MSMVPASLLARSIHALTTLDEGGAGTTGAPPGRPSERPRRTGSGAASTVTGPHLAMADRTILHQSDILFATAS